MTPRFFQKLLIREKLILIITLTSAIALALAFTAFSINDLWVLSQKQKNKLDIIARIVAENSQAAISFQDSKAAEDLLESLKVEPHITAAGIYDHTGKNLAKYKDLSDENYTAIPAPRQFYDKGFLHVYQIITLDKKDIGFVYIKSDIRELSELIKNYLIYGFIIILACLAIALTIAATLQRSISGPVKALTHVAEMVSRQKNYSQRAKKRNDDELGNLVDRFNEMLSEIEQRDRALVRSNRDLEQFAYVASHDLQEPLRMVINYVELLELQWKQAQDPHVKQYMGFIMEGAQRSQQLIKDLLEYSRVCNAGGQFQEISMQSVLDKALTHLKYTIEQSKAIITYDPLPTLSGDAVKLTQLFQNLLANAIKFRKENETPKIHIGVKKEDHHWAFSIQDNGIGIEPEYFERIFIIFKRLHTRETYAGTGIGLAICKRVVEQHGGKIWVESAPQHGAIFHFTLPVSPNT